MISYKILETVRKQTKNGRTIPIPRTTVHPNLLTVKNVHYKYVVLSVAQYSQLIRVFNMYTSCYKGHCI